MSGKTYNVKDKFTGKSYTYKYSEEEKEVKTFKALTEGKFSPALIKKAIAIANKREFKQGNYSGAVRAIEKLKKGLSDDPKVANGLRIANETFKRGATEGKLPPALQKAIDKKKGKKVDDDEDVDEAFDVVDESKMGDLLIDIQSGATAKEIAKYHNISIQTAKNFLSDYYSSKKTRTAPGLKKEGLDAVDPKAVKKKFKDRKDKDIDNDGDTDDSDEFLHKKRKAISKAMKKEETVSFNEWVSKNGKRRRVKDEDNRISKLKEWEAAAEAEGDKVAYQKFFNGALKKFGVSSPDELKGDNKKKFFAYVDKNWTADHEEEVDVHKSYKMDGRRKNFKEKMRKLGYIKPQY
jgi:hypothetical protein